MCYSVTMETCKIPTNTVAYISSNCSFSASRLLSMLDYHGNDDEVSDINIDCFFSFRHFL